MRHMRLENEAAWEYAERNPTSLIAEWLKRSALEIDQHAIAPAVAERDRRIAEMSS